MATFEKMRQRIEAQLSVNSKRLMRRMRKLDADDILSLYEEGSNQYFHSTDLEQRALGAMLLSASVQVLTERYEAVKSLDLTKPFPLRDWVHGVPQTDAE